MRTLSVFISRYFHKTPNNSFRFFCPSYCVVKFVITQVDHNAENWTLKLFVWILLIIIVVGLLLLLFDCYGARLHGHLHQTYSVALQFHPLHIHLYFHFFRIIARTTVTTNTLHDAPITLSAKLGRRGYQFLGHWFDHAHLLVLKRTFNTLSHSDRYYYDDS